MGGVADGKPDIAAAMERALALAARGLGAVEPNPTVGAVIVREPGAPAAAPGGGRIVELACGWHRRFGGPHAEVEALAAARAAGHDVRGATMLITLEPCCHYGKTPPCTDAIIAAGLARVVVAVVDPDPWIAGRGIERLRRAGIQVEVGLGEVQARRLLAAYIKLRTKGRPWVICKWAQTADGFLALPPGHGRWVSCQASRDKVYELRGWCDGVCVGVGTVLADDPLLMNRSGRGRQPARLVLDSCLRIPLACRLVVTAPQGTGSEPSTATCLSPPPPPPPPPSPVIVATTAAGAAAEAAKAAALRRAGVELIELPPDPAGVSLPALLDELGRRQWTRLLVEGGPTVLRSVILGGLADEIWVFISPRIAISPPGAAARGLVDDAAATVARQDAEAGETPAGRGEEAGETPTLRDEEAGETAEPAALAGLPRLDITELAPAAGLPAPAEERIGDDRLMRYVLT